MKRISQSLSRLSSRLKALLALTVTIIGAAGSYVVYTELDRRGYFYCCYLWGKEVDVATIEPTSSR